MYYNLFTIGKLNAYLHDIDIRARESLVKQIAD